MMSRTPEPGTLGTARALSRPLPGTVRVVNVGLALLGNAVQAQQAEVVDVRWRIPALGKEDLVGSLTRLFGPQTERIDQANREVLRRLEKGSPQLTRIGSALGELPGITSLTILHCGPSLPWAQFCDPLRRSVLAAITAKGLAASPAEAGAMVERGEVVLEPANHHDTVLPMATALGPSAPVVVAENPVGGNRAYSGLNQGPGNTPWFRADGPDAVQLLRFLRDTVAPVLSEALQASGPIDILTMVARDCRWATTPICVPRRRRTS